MSCLFVSLADKLSRATVIRQRMRSLQTSAGLLASYKLEFSCWQVPTEYALGTLRLSTGRHTTEQDVHKAAELIIAGAKKQGVRVS